MFSTNGILKGVKKFKLFLPLLSAINKTSFRETERQHKGKNCNEVLLRLSLKRQINSNTEDLKNRLFL